MNLNREMAAEKNFVDRYDAARAERERVSPRSRSPFQPRTARTTTPARTTAQAGERTSWRPSQARLFKFKHLFLMTPSPDLEHRLSLERRR